MRIPRWIYSFRDFLACPPLVFVLISFKNEIENNYFIWPLGIFIFLTGLAIRIWAQQHLHYRLGVSKQLTTSGLYNFTRNPLYVGNILIALGLTVVSELIWFIPVTFFWLSITYVFVVRYEEAHLSRKYGERYRKYTSEVSRWIPMRPIFRNLEITNKYFFKTMLTESRCLYLIVPYIVKELVEPYFEH